jgi:poly(hydroxyalkanoate) depolymerase family esterase
MKALMRALLVAGALALAATGVVARGAPPAAAASLVQVTNFGTNPSNLQMYVYVPDSVRPNPPILVALHQCTGSGPGFFSGTEFASLANQYGFIVVYPSVTRSGSCWDVSSSQALTRNGGSDPVGIMSMITYAEQHYGGNSNQVYVTGASSGAMMTNVMLADYPDVFKAGAAYMGVPYHCFFTGTVDGWNSQCADGQVSMTAPAWGDLVRNTADPGYSGPRPRMQLWHGTADGTLNYNNFGEEIKQWTNVLGVSQTPTSTDTPASGWTRTRYDNSSGAIEVEAYSIAGAGHVLPETGMAAYAIHFFGLDSTSTTPPPTSPPPTSPPPTSPPPTSPPPTSPPPGGTCHVTYTKSSEWAGGFVANVTINNTGTSTINGWKLTFTFPGDQKITSGWNATVTQSGEGVTATNASYDATIAPGGNTSAGLQGTWTSSDSAPTSFSVNGTACN